MQTEISDQVNSKQDQSLITRLFDTSKPYDIEGVPLKLYLLLAALALTLLYLDKLESAGVAGAYASLWTIGFFFYAIGERVRILKALLGGGLVVAYAGAAVTAYTGLITEDQVAYVQSHMIGNRFMYFLLAALLISSILSVTAAVLKKALFSLAPIILGGLGCAAMGGILAGWLVGMSTERVVTMYFLPIMGGGTGAGAIPMSEVYADVTGGSATEYFNFAIGVLTLGNIAAILTASMLAQIARRLKFLSGDGKLVRGVDQEIEADQSVAPEQLNTHAAMALTVCILMAGVILAETIGLIHMFAWMTIIAILINFTKIVPAGLRESMAHLSAWGMKAFIVTILVAFGLSADFDVISKLFNLGNLFIIVSIVMGAAMGAGLVSYFVKCYPLEGALSGGLCMANAGGGGDLQVLGAARRLQLYPYAQISSRLGGAFMLVLGNYLFELFA